MYFARVVLVGKFPGHVFHIAVADLDTSPVEDLVEFVRFREVPVEESEENLSNVGVYTLTKRRVEPNDFTGSLSSLLVSAVWGAVAGILQLHGKHGQGYQAEQQQDFETNPCNARQKLQPQETRHLSSRWGVLDR